MSDSNIMGKNAAVKVIHDAVDGLTKEKAEIIYEKLLAEMKATLDAPKGSVRLAGIGSIVKKPLAARIGCKPGTTEKISIPARETYKLKAQKKVI